MDDKLFVSSVQMKNADNYTRWTFDQFKPYLHGKVLEVGCGVGSFTRLMAKESGCRVLHAIDISAEAVREIRKDAWPANVSIEHCDVADIKEAYDFILCLNVMEHVRGDKAFLSKLFSLLDTRGILFLLVPAHQSLYSRFDAAASHFRRYSKRDMKKFDLPADIRMVDQFYFNPCGAFGYWLTYKVLKKSPMADASCEIGFFDRVLVPVVRRVSFKQVPFGLSLISIFEKR